jgi:hypothetical protein
MPSLKPPTLPSRFLWSAMTCFLLLCGFSCVATDHAERVYLSLPPAATKPEVLGQIPSRPYDIVADIQWQGGTQAKMAQRAQMLGGDAVIVQFLGGLVPYNSITAEEANASNTVFNRMTGTVIKYK